MKLPVPKIKYICGSIMVINYYILGGHQEKLQYQNTKREERYKKGLFVDFEYDIKNETDEWEKWYIPPPYIQKDDLILDVGGRDGDTVLFYAEHGYKNIRVIEPEDYCQERLKRNCEQISNFFGIKIEIRYKIFTKEDLIGVKFAKFDCEGCEYEIDLKSLGIPIVVELHTGAKRNSMGIYKSNSLFRKKYIRSIGYVRYNV